MARREGSQSEPDSGPVGALSVEIATTMAPGNDRRVTLAVRLTALANVALFAAKLFAFIVSGSQSILASLADSGVDLTAQIVVLLCDAKSRKVDRNYPVGKARLETVGALIIACIMTFAAVSVIQSAIGDLSSGIGSDDPPVPKMDTAVYAILGLAITLKAALFGWCYALRKVSDTTFALAHDHRNDVLSNTVVIVAATLASAFNHKYWYIDPIGGILISIFIIACWLILANKQIAKIVGVNAPAEFYEKIREMANEHEGIQLVDTIRAYHLGLRYFVEIDVVMPGSVLLFNSHDAALELQKKVEGLDEVERAFVHVDYEQRNYPEHKLDWSMC